MYLNWFSKPQLNEKEIILLDTILATGKTVSAVCSKIKKLEKKVKSINIMACYASPEAINLLLDNDNINNIYVAVISETLNKDGFLIPQTYGDAGDKCFGKTI